MSKDYPQECGQVVENCSQIKLIKNKKNAHITHSDCTRNNICVKQKGSMIKNYDIKIKSKYSTATQIALWLLAFVLCWGVMFVCNGKLFASDNANFVGADATTVHTISNEAELTAFATAVNAGTSYADKIVKLTNDITMETTTWAGIGSYSKNYTGTFDGNNHVITFKNQVSTSGLFGRISSATIKNVGVNYAGGALDVVGGIVGTVDLGSTKSANFVMSNSFAIGSNITGVGVFGGVVGAVYANDGSAIIENCYANYKQVVSAGQPVNYIAGGIIGYGYINDGSISSKNCYVQIGNIELINTYNEYISFNCCGYGSYTDCFAVIGSLKTTTTGTVYISAGGTTSYCKIGSVNTTGASAVTDGYNNYNIDTLDEIVKDSSNFTTAGFTAGGTTYTWTNGWDFTNTWYIQKGYNGGYPMLKGFVYEPDLTDTTVTFLYTTNNGNSVFVYILDANKSVVRQIVLNGTSGVQKATTIVVAANEEFTLFVYQSLYMVTTIDGEALTKKAYVPTTDTLGITLTVSLPAQSVGNWVTV